MAEAGRKRVWHVVALIVGAVLFVGAGYLALRQLDVQALLDAEPWQLGVMGLCVVGNLALTGLLLWLITLNFAHEPRVSVMRMTSLVCASALLNYLPLRPGLLGRAAYLKAHHKLAVRDSVVILAIVMGLGSLILGAAVAITLLFDGQAMLWVAGVATVLVTVMTRPVADRVLKRPIAHGWTWALLRIGDLLLASLRLWLALQIVGYPAPFSDAVLLAAAGLFVSLTGLTPNGLGLREWLIALIAGAMASEGAVDVVALTAAAAIIDRGMEAIVVIIAGGASLLQLRPKQTAG